MTEFMSKSALERAQVARMKRRIEAEADATWDSATTRAIGSQDERDRTLRDEGCSK